MSVLFWKWMSLWRSVGGFVRRSMSFTDGIVNERSQIVNLWHIESRPSQARARQTGDVPAALGKRLRVPYSIRRSHGPMLPVASRRGYRDTSSNTHSIEIHSTHVLSRTDSKRIQSKLYLGVLHVYHLS